MKAKSFKSRLLDGDFFELINNNEQLINVWFQPKTNNFCLMLNAKVIKSTKTFDPIWNKLKQLADATPNNSVVFNKLKISK